MCIRDSFAGVPAKKVKDITPELMAGEVERIAKNYGIYASWLRSDADTSAR
jgi:hypothetical protein